MNTISNRNQDGLISIPQLFSIARAFYVYESTRRISLSSVAHYGDILVPSWRFCYFHGALNLISGRKKIHEIDLFLYFGVFHEFFVKNIKKSISQKKICLRKWRFLILMWRFFEIKTIGNTAQYVYVLSSVVVWRGTGTRNPWWKEAAFLTGRKLDQERSSKHHHYHHHRQARPIFFGEFCSLHIRTYLVGEINILLIIHFERVCASRISLGYFLHVDFFPSLIDAIYIWVS